MPGFPDDTHRAAPCTPFKLISAASTNSNLIQAGATVLTWYFLSNQNAAVRYVKFYDKGSAPTVGTDTPKLTLAVPALASAHITFVHPMQFVDGLGVGITTGVGDANTGAVAADEIVVNVGYI